MNVNELLNSKKIFLKITGMWPEECKSRPLYSWFKIYFGLIIASTFCSLQPIGIVMVADADNVLEYIIDLCGLFTCFSRIYILIANRSEILQLLENTKKLEYLPQDNEDEVKIVKFWQSCRNTCINYGIRGFFILWFAYATIPLFTADKVLPIKLMVKPNSIDSPWYEILCLVISVSLGLALLNIVTSDIIFITLLCQLYAELRLIKYFASTINFESNGNEKLIKLIRRHVMILTYGDSICKILSNVCLFQHFLLFVIICLTSFILLTSENPMKVKRVLWVLIIACAIMLTICFVGEHLTTVSEDITEAFIQTNLNLYDAKLTSSDRLANLRHISFVLLRAQKPLRLSVGTFGLINLQFFSSTMRSVFSFMAVLRRAYD